MNPHDMVDEALLGAYLDGEVTSDERTQVEESLRNNASYRTALEEMKLLRMHMQQLPSHRLGEGFARGVLETAERMQPVPEQERVDRHVEEPVGPETSARTWLQRHWQGWVLGLATAAALVLVVRLMIPSGGVSPGGPGLEVPAQVADSTSHLRSSDSEVPTVSTDSPGVAPKSVDPEVVSTTTDVVEQDPPRTGKPISPGKPVVPESKDPVVNNPASDVPGLEQLLGNRLLFVVEVAMTPEGVKNRRMDQILMNHGIVYDRAIEIDRPLEQSILQSRHLKGMVAKRENDSEDYLDVDLVYVVCNGQQVDDTTTALRDFPGEIAGHRFNLAMLPQEVQTFQTLHDVVAKQWDAPAPGDPSRKPAVIKARAGRLLTELVLLSRLARPLGTTSLLKVDPVPLPDKPGDVVPVKKPSILPGGGVATMPCEVLFVVRHLPAREVE